MKEPLHIDNDDFFESIEKPYAWLLMDSTIESAYSYNLRKHKDDRDIPLYTKREWCGLTDEEIKHVEETTTCLKNESWLRNLTRNIEAKLKEKNT